MSQFLTLPFNSGMFHLPCLKCWMEISVCITETWNQWNLCHFILRVSCMIIALLCVWLQALYLFHHQLAHPVLKCLHGTEHGWLVELLYAFNSGWYSVQILLKVPISFHSSATLFLILRRSYEVWKPQEALAKAGTVLYHTIPYYTKILYYTIPYHTIPYHTIPYSNVLCCTVLYCTVLYHPLVCNNPFTPKFKKYILPTLRV